MKVCPCGGQRPGNFALGWRSGCRVARFHQAQNGRRHLAIHAAANRCIQVERATRFHVAALLRAVTFTLAGTARYVDIIPQNFQNKSPARPSRPRRCLSEAALTASTDTVGGTALPRKNTRPWVNDVELAALQSLSSTAPGGRLAGAVRQSGLHRGPLRKGGVL